MRNEVLDRIRGLQRSLEQLRQRQRVATTRDPKIREVEERVAALQAEAGSLDAERRRLVARRRELQRELGPLIGREVMPLARVEKTNGVASFVFGVRMMQRIHRKAPDPTAGFDGAGEVFRDPDRTAEFVRSHGVPLSTGTDPGPADRRVVLHAFHGPVGLVEVRSGDAARHTDHDGADLGDVRPHVPHDPDIPLPTTLRDLVGWATTLSDHVSRPYVQIVWRQDGDHLALVGIDVDPDRIPVLVEEQDRRLGHLFDSGHARMLKQPYLLGALDNRVPDGIFDPDPALDRRDAP